MARQDIAGLLTGISSTQQPVQQAVPGSPNFYGEFMAARGRGLQQGLGGLMRGGEPSTQERIQGAMFELSSPTAGGAAKDTATRIADLTKLARVQQVQGNPAAAAQTAAQVQQLQQMQTQENKAKKVKSIRDAVVSRIKDDPRYIDILPAVQQGLFDDNPKELAELLKRETVKGIKLSKPFAGISPAGNPLMLTIRSKEGEDDVIVDLAGKAPPAGTVLSTKDGTKVEVNLTEETQDAFSQELGKGLAKDLIESRNKAAVSLLTADVLNNQWELVSEGIGVISGTGTNILLGVGKALVAGGLLSGEGEDLIANTEAYLANAGNLVAEVITAFGAGTGLSDQDRKFAIAMAAGDPAVLTEEGIKRILKLQAKITKFKIEQHNKKVANSPASTSVYDMTVNVPEFPWAADLEDDVQYPKDVSELLKKYTTKQAGG